MHGKGVIYTELESDELDPAEWGRWEGIFRNGCWQQGTEIKGEEERFDKIYDEHGHLKHKINVMQQLTC